MKCFTKCVKTRKEFYRDYRSAYNVAMKNGWIDDYTWFKKQVTN